MYNKKRIPYSGKFSREKIFANERDRAFRESSLLFHLCQQNKTFTDNIFANSLKFAKSFSRENSRYTVVVYSVCIVETRFRFISGLEMSFYNSCFLVSHPK